LLFAQRASAKYGVPTADILVEMGNRKAVGGQEDLIEEVAIGLVSAREESDRHTGRRHHSTAGQDVA
jgi:4-hydroxy-2-oxovalerate/4-hydroxy-2-oxohexanoate aldolase